MSINPNNKPKAECRFELPTILSFALIEDMEGDLRRRIVNFISSSSSSPSWFRKNKKILKKNKSEISDLKATNDENWKLLEILKKLFALEDKCVIIEKESLSILHSMVHYRNKFKEIRKTLHVLTTQKWYQLSSRDCIKTKKINIEKKGNRVNNSVAIN
ncbi:hypothetical protein BpHYR1_052923 [Brachionus plicatilis]|uniref:Uncharacterized protein n=1 Tax=Brachionus plicatilis TaxID=10195 RepID=A0A3M7S9W2_BRAPC|nr:hypothetical protein BpHYR1_052923 [Brachionus plicatilis]